MKINAICENRDFKRVYSRGRSLVTPYVVIYFLRNRNTKIRVGITASKKIGGAVVRNRARRVLREGVREIIDSLPQNYDIVLVARGKTPHAKSSYINALLVKQFKSAGLLQ